MQANKENICIENRMKRYKLKCLDKIPYDKPFVCRIKMHNFKNMIHKFKSPSDPLFFKIMAETAGDLLYEFNCSSAYYCQDEISLIFNKISLTDETMKASGL